MYNNVYTENTYDYALQVDLISLIKNVKIYGVAPNTGSKTAGWAIDFIPISGDQP